MAKTRIGEQCQWIWGGGGLCDAPCYAVPEEVSLITCDWGEGNAAEGRQGLVLGVSPCHVAGMYRTNTVNNTYARNKQVLVLVILNMLLIIEDFGTMFQ